MIDVYKIVVNGNTYYHLTMPDLEDVDAHVTVVSMSIEMAKKLRIIQ